MRQFNEFDNVGLLIKMARNAVKKNVEERTHTRSFVNNIIESDLIWLLNEAMCVEVSASKTKP